MTVTGKDATRDFGFTVTRNYSGVTKIDLTPAYIITAIRIAHDIGDILAQINAVISFINGLK